MNAPAKGMLKVSSILLIIFGAIGVFFYSISFACVAAIGSAVNGLAATASDLGADMSTVSNAAAAVSGALTIAVILGFIAAAIGSIAMLVFGIMGMKRYENAAQGQFFITAGIILCALFLLSIILSFSIISLLLCALPILFIIGGVQNKNAAAAPAAPAAQ
jgi:hypothetical protein